MKTIELITAADNYHLLTGRTPTMLNRFLSQRFRDQGILLTREQWSILAVLWISDGCSQQHLATATYRDKPSTTRLIDNLEKEGYIARRSDPTDRRTNQIFLTPKGKKAEGHVTSVVYSALEEATEGLSEKEIKDLKSTLDKVYSNLEKKLK